MNQKEEIFTDTVWSFYKTHGRHALPWRKTKNPYRILVSEIMLQQTQVDRVIPKYKAFIKRWPVAEDLAIASLAEVLREWQGLGYNRRARLLHNCVREVVGEHGGRFPGEYEKLLKLPGIGPYTAGAVMAFAYNKPIPIVETNIRTVYIHHFYNKAQDVSEERLLQKVKKTLPEENVREWYAALMDYGSYLKKEVGNLNKQAKVYQKQSSFKGSDREVRGAIIKKLSSECVTEARLVKELPVRNEKIKEQLQKLLKEEMIVKVGKSYSLPD